jgi:hypothetical protein
MRCGRPIGLRAYRRYYSTDEEISIVEAEVG